jgi:hypothetical protein
MKRSILYSHLIFPLLVFVQLSGRTSQAADFNPKSGCPESLAFMSSAEGGEPSLLTHYLVTLRFLVDRGVIGAQELSQIRESAEPVDLSGSDLSLLNIQESRAFSKAYASRFPEGALKKAWNAKVVRESVDQILKGMTSAVEQRKEAQQETRFIYIINGPVENLPLPSKVPFWWRIDSTSGQINASDGRAFFALANSSEVTYITGGKSSDSGIHIVNAREGRISHLPFRGAHTPFFTEGENGQVLLHLAETKFKEFDVTRFWTAKRVRTFDAETLKEIKFADKNLRRLPFWRLFNNSLYENILLDGKGNYWKTTPLLKRGASGFKVTRYGKEGKKTMIFPAPLPPGATAQDKEFFSNPTLHVTRDGRFHMAVARGRRLYIYDESEKPPQQHDLQSTSYLRFHQFFETKEGNLYFAMSNSPTQVTLIDMRTAETQIFAMPFVDTSKTGTTIQGEQVIQLKNGKLVIVASKVADDPGVFYAKSKQPAQIEGLYAIDVSSGEIHNVEGVKPLDAWRHLTAWQDAEGRLKWAYLNNESGVSVVNMQFSK